MKVSHLATADLLKEMSTESQIKKIHLTPKMTGARYSMCLTPSILTTAERFL